MLEYNKNVVSAQIYAKVHWVRLQIKSNANKQDSLNHSNQNYPQVRLDWCIPLPSMMQCWLLYAESVYYFPKLNVVCKNLIYFPYQRYTQIRQPPF